MTSLSGVISAPRFQTLLSFGKKNVEKETSEVHLNYMKIISAEERPFISGIIISIKIC